MNSDSVFAGYPIPYPKREFLSDEEQDDKSEANKVGDAWRVSIISHF